MRMAISLPEQAIIDMFDLMGVDTSEWGPQEIAHSLDFLRDRIKPAQATSYNRILQLVQKVYLLGGEVIVKDEEARGNPTHRRLPPGFDRVPRNRPHSPKTNPGQRGRRKQTA